MRRKPKRGNPATERLLARDLRATLIGSKGPELLDLQDNLYRTASRLQDQMIETDDPGERERLFIMLARFSAEQCKSLVQVDQGEEPLCETGQHSWKAELALPDKNNPVNQISAIARERLRCLALSLESDLLLDAIEGEPVKEPRSTVGNARTEIDTLMPVL